jgi:predicted hydrocarbon binding protein
VEKYDQPGMLLAQFDSPMGKIYTRIILIPEDILVNFENLQVKKNPSNAAKLYSMGKNVGYNIAHVFKSSSMKSQGKADVEKFINFMTRFNFSTWAQSVDILKLDAEKKIFNIKYSGHVVCRKNGKGYLLVEGMYGGFLAYTFNDKTVESVKLKCQGRGDKFCEECISPRSFFTANNIKFFKAEPELLNFNDNKYLQMNALKPCQYATSSLKKLIEQKIFQLTGMHIKYKDMSMINISDVFIYILEMNLDNKSKDMLYDISFESGKSIKNIPNTSFIVNFISALGWGDLLIQSAGGKVAAKLDMFPWRYEEKDIADFSLFSGFISGLLSSYYKKDLRLRKIKKTYVGNSFSVLMT